MDKSISRSPSTNFDFFFVCLTDFKILSIIYIFLFFSHSAITKAVETAINSRQWAKAVQILELQDSALASRYYKKIADHYASIGEYEVRAYFSLLNNYHVEINC